MAKRKIGSTKDLPATDNRLLLRSMPAAEKVKHFNRAIKMMQGKIEQHRIAIAANDSARESTLAAFDLLDAAITKIGRSI